MSLQISVTAVCDIVVPPDDDNIDRHTGHDVIIVSAPAAVSSQRRMEATFCGISVDER